jgi:hypothetical protein
MSNQLVFPVKVSINQDYQEIIDFYTKKEGYSLSKLFNVLLSEVQQNKPQKFKVLKKLEKLKI